MRRKEKEMKNEDVLQVLENGSFGFLGTITPDGRPYGIPLNYCFVNGRIYFHCATKGKKLNCFRSNERVSFCVVTRSTVIPEKFETDFESCMAEGVIEEAEGDEKVNGLKGLIDKYSSEFIDEGLELIRKLDKKTKVFRITLESVSGKASIREE